MSSDPALEPSKDGRRRGDEVADAVHVEDEPVVRPSCGSPSSRAIIPFLSHEAMRASGGIETWQIATASASASCDVAGSAESDRSIRTMRETWPLSALP